MTGPAAGPAEGSRASGAELGAHLSKASATLADGRELVYYGDRAGWAASYPDRRSLPARVTASELRYDPLYGEWVIYAGHRQDRTFLPSAGDCPLCPSMPGRLTEIPAPSYQVAVFENRFPALTGPPAGVPAVEGQPGAPDGPGGLLARRAGGGRCEVICFSPDHDASFAGLAPGQVALILEAWTDRSAALAARPGVVQVYCFENRGAEIGATLPHPHGQIYAYPFLTPRTAQLARTSMAYRQEVGRNLFEDLVSAERSDGSRIVVAGTHWTAFVPHAARWPYEVHLYPRRRVPALAGLTVAERAEFGVVYLDVLGRLDRLFGAPAPYVSGWHQAPAGPGGAEFVLHLELFTVRRAPGKLKYLAGSESGMGAFTNDIEPEAAAARLRQLG